MTQGRARFNLNFLNRLSTRGRVGVIIVFILVVLLLVYMGTRYFFSGNMISGSQVATPTGMQSIPGGSNLSARYQQTIEQANAQRQQQSQLAGGSAVPTQLNYGSASTCIICSDQSANVKNLLDNWVSQGAIPQDVADTLSQLAAQNVPVSQFANELDDLVKQGKLTPEQARQLLDEYKKQHANAAQAAAAQLMDSLAKSGDLPTDVASQLLADQKAGMSPADYAKALQQLVKEGKISPQTAQQLLAQYNKARADEAAKENAAQIQAMAHNGTITPDEAAALTDLANRDVPYDEYKAALDKAVAEGKLTPAAEAQLLAAYQAKKEAAGPSSMLADLVKNAPDPATAQKLQAEADKLNALQANNASPEDYANELKQAVAAGILTPDQAAQLMDAYQAALNPTAPIPVAGSGSFATLAQRAQTGATPAETGNAATESQFAAAAAQAEQQAAAARQDQLDALAGAMSTQAGQLVSAWQEPPQMDYREGTPETKSTSELTATGTAAAGSGTTAGSSTAATASPIIRAGTILFAVLDTSVNSDYPDSPVMATIVSGDFKGAKLLGKLVTVKGVAGQMDRISLNFTLMNLDAWPDSKTVTAYAIDPDTARSVMASNVNYHYFKRFGAIMATSFLQGYGNAIQSQGTSTTGIFGTSTSHPELSPGENISVGLGQVGQTLGAATQNYINIPPTVTVDSGVGLGILFMADVT